MQYKVPQNIDKEDQIVGSLTLIQFSYLAIGGALDFLVYKAMGGFFAYLLMTIITLPALALAFLKIQDQSLMHFIAAALDYSRRPKTRVWDKLSDRPILQVQPKAAVKKDLSQSTHKEFNSQKVAELSNVLDSGGPAENTEPPAQAMPFKNVDSDVINNQSPIQNTQSLPHKNQ